jgi:uncharacterized protein
MILGRMIRSSQRTTFQPTSSCSTKPPLSRRTDPLLGGLVDRAMTISPMDNPLDLAQQIYAALDDEDTGPFLELCAPDATVEYPAAGRLPYGGNWSGKVSIDQFLAAHEAAEEILVFQPAQMHAAGDMVFVLGRFEGRARDSGKTWSTNFVHVLTVRNGLLARWQSFFDTGAALEAHS